MTSLKKKKKKEAVVAEKRTAPTLQKLTQS